MILRFKWNNFWKKGLFLSIFVAALSLTVACSQQIVEKIDLSEFGPAIPKNFFIGSENPSKALINLGRKLYYEPRLSKSNLISCNSCHNLSNYGVDNEKTSPGHLNQRGGRNSPTVYHAAPQIAQFWDGRAETVEEQALGPILNPIEMGMISEAKVLEVLNSMPEYVTAFKRAFPQESDPVTYENIGTAIGTFERGLVTPAPFDRYFAGDESALNEQQKRGLKLFASDCASCHFGNNFGGEMFGKLGLEKEWQNKEDLGRYEVTKKEEDRLKFKVPILRNVAETAPYFHDGSVATLEEAVKLMAEYQTKTKLSESEVQDIIAFLNSLTGELPKDYISKPVLPKSTAQTPLPDLS